MNLFGGEKSAITLTFLAFFCIGNSFGIPYTKKLREDVRYCKRDMVAGAAVLWRENVHCTFFLEY